MAVETTTLRAERRTRRTRVSDASTEVPGLGALPYSVDRIGARLWHSVSGLGALPYFPSCSGQLSTEIRTPEAPPKRFARRSCCSSAACLGHHFPGDLLCARVAGRRRRARDARARSRAGLAATITACRREPRHVAGSRLHRSRGRDDCFARRTGAHAGAGLACLWANSEASNSWTPPRSGRALSQKAITRCARRPHQRQSRMQTPPFR